MRDDSSLQSDAWELLNQLFARFSDFELWPIGSALLHHLLVKESVTRAQYSRGVFIIADILCEAADLQKRKGEPVNLDIHELSDLRKRHGPTQQQSRQHVRKSAPPQEPANAQ